MIRNLFKKPPKKIGGVWFGVVHYGESRREKQFKCKLSQYGTLIKGVLKTNEVEKVASYQVRGLMDEGGYLQISIVNEKSDVMNYANGVLQPDQSYSKFKGYFIGRSRSIEEVVRGEIEMWKE
ncbi:MAG: hypothetical protein AAB407_03575 [Patescibacteria group bacterium]